MSKKNKILVPEAMEALQNMKMEIAKDIGYPGFEGMKSGMHSSLVNGLSVREMVSMGESLYTNIHYKKPSDYDIY